MAKPMKRAIVVPILIILNAAVFVLWYIQGPQSAIMTDDFLVSWDGLMAGRWWTLVTSVFSHNWWLHIFVNMFVLNSFGTLLEHVLGHWRFLAFYIVAGIMASLTHALVSNYYLHTPDVRALGASGSIAGLVWVFSLLFPKEKILLFGILPMPAILGALAFVGLDLWGLSAQAAGGGLPLGHGAHLGGALAGILFYVFHLRKYVRRD